MKKFAAIFDMDGTMVDNTPYHLKSWQTLFKKYDMGDLSPETYYTQISGVPIMDTLKRLFPDAEESRLRGLLQEKEGLYKQLYGPYATPINGLENFLIELKNAGIKLAMASSATIDDIDFILSHVPVRNYFDAIIDGNRVSKSKPNPQIFLKAADDLGVKPEDCVVFEDSLAGIKAANAAGMKVIGITTSHPPDKLQPADLIIADYTALDFKKLADLFN
ncbi:HAD family phosphatase [Mucilaginibacter sp.]|uniref:HAD family hydrolase n=1 Tax=Mucilaginibacter sp. TaxID=1882438 RepID=UPI00261C35D8|nr:HAD family phosphatase [Mucilaginibacter sp.]MDB5030043.1 beta-phosphoglucomutase family hydrolase [Mucilaginibacter sp.]